MTYILGWIIAYVLGIVTVLTAKYWLPLIKSKLKEYIAEEVVNLTKKDGTKDA
jgi:hypothetical protein